MWITKRNPTGTGFQNIFNNDKYTRALIKDYILTSLQYYSVLVNTIMVYTRTTIHPPSVQDIPLLPGSRPYEGECKQ